MSQASPLPSADQYFKSFLLPPKVAWPTVCLLLASLAIIGATSVQVLAGAWPHWVALPVNGFAIYLLFSVAHDGSHRSISRYPWLNELVGRIGIMLLLPIAPWDGVRWLHMQHHRFTNGAQDPDQWVHHWPLWTRLFTWPNVDVFYLHYFLTKGGDFMRRNIGKVVFNTVLFVGALAYGVYAGHGLDILFLWFLPCRIALLLITLVFIYLPHYPGEVEAQKNVYRASTLRRGLEWFLTPVLVYQNYHLIHHLYPTAPFYTYGRLFHLKYPELAGKDVALQHGLGIRLINPAPTASAT